jgi:hypothetical protein
MIAFAGSILDIVAGLTSIRMAQGCKSFEAILTGGWRSCISSRNTGLSRSVKTEMRCEPVYD